MLHIHDPRISNLTVHTGGHSTISSDSADNNVLTYVILDFPAQYVCISVVAHCFRCV